VADNILSEFIATALLIIGLYVGWIYFKNRTKYYLVLLITIIFLLALTVLDLFLPGYSLVDMFLDRVGIALPIRILLTIILSISFLVFLFYPNIKRLINLIRGR
jgi:hypothetical protein